MSTAFINFLGVDASGSEKPFTYAVLNTERVPILSGEADLEEMAALARTLSGCLTAVNAPQAVNRGLVRRSLEARNLPSGQLRGSDLRVAERELRQHGIQVSATPGRRESCPAWMQGGFELYRLLNESGHQPFPTRKTGSQWIETNPHACFCALLGQVPLPAPTLEGRLQRQLILHESGLGIRDPMDFFEEITRHRLMRGILPMERIFTPNVLNALVAAWTAWKCVHEKEATCFVGDREEGRLALPVARMQVSYMNAEFPEER